MGALDARPGVRSARFAGPDASDDENVERLLRELDAAPRRTRRPLRVGARALSSDRSSAAPGRSRAGSARSAVPKASATTRCSFRRPRPDGGGARRCLEAREQPPRAGRAGAAPAVRKVHRRGVDFRRAALLPGHEGRRTRALPLLRRPLARGAPRAREGDRGHGGRRGKVPHPRGRRSEFFVIVDGEVAVTKDGSEIRTMERATSSARSRCSRTVPYGDRHREDPASLLRPHAPELPHAPRPAAGARGEGHERASKSACARASPSVPRPPARGRPRLNHQLISAPSTSTFAIT